MILYKRMIKLWRLPIGWEFGNEHIEETDWLDENDEGVLEKEQEWLKNNEWLVKKDDWREFWEFRVTEKFVKI